MTTESVLMTKPKYYLFLHIGNKHMSQTKTSMRFFDDREMFISGIEYSYYYEEGE